ncbi:MAG: glycosyltransferase family 2 protein [Actinomycetota bacterium]|nr:glycosyltransferase family 2 protein [Actinomycetota bacterium]
MIAVITTAFGRHDHLRLQLEGLRASHTAPDLHVVVAMGDAAIRDVCGKQATVIDVPPGADGRLPVAAARNAGARHALEHGADVVIFLDVDCVPSATLVGQYAHTARFHSPPALLSGNVGYLPPPPEAGYRIGELADLAEAHPARPGLHAGETRPLEHDLFWSLSFALRAELWPAIGGFHERYTGYGAEDTDFARTARANAVPHLAIGGAWAYHQWHPSPEPPLQHLHDILRNGRLFRDRWAEWPMRGWLDGFAELGLIRYDAATDDWHELVRKDALAAQPS